MYLGRTLELADQSTLFERLLHPYTEALLPAVPVPDPDAERSGRIVLSSDVRSPLAPPSGCHFHTRCPYAMVRCKGWRRRCASRSRVTWRPVIVTTPASPGRSSGRRGAEAAMAT